MIKKFRSKKIKVKKEFLFLILIITLATALRLWNVFEVTVNNDEGLHGRLALEMSRGGKIIFSPGVPWQGPMIVYILTPSTYLFGNSILALRIPILILSILTMFLLYLYIKNLYGKETAIVALFVYSILPFVIKSDFTATEFSPLLFFILFDIYLFHKYRKTNSNKFLYLFSLISGFAVMTRLSFLFFLFSFFLTLKINPDNQYKKKYKKYNFKKILILSVLFIIGIYPMLHYNLFNDFPTIRYALRNFPKTEFNENLMDVGKNISREFFWFYIFFNCKNFFILGLFVFSLITFIAYPLYYSYYKKIKKNQIILKKNLFIVLNLLILFLIISTITVTAFKIEELIMISPFYSIIIGWSLVTIIKKLRKFSKLYCFEILFFITLFILFITYTSMYEDLINNTKNYYCMEYGLPLSSYVYQMNCSSIVTDTNSLRDFLGWYIPDKEFQPLTFDFDSIDIAKGRLNIDFGEGKCYIFSIKKCQLIESKELFLKVNQTFFEFIDKYNRIILREETFYSKEGDEIFKIYKIS
jgi:4-amino-4-deoxy-L-arabinose transferase-like glycosyltransferase